MATLKLLMVDNYDSFTFNIVQYFGELGAEVEVFRNDEITVGAVIARNPERHGPSKPSSPGKTRRRTRPLSFRYLSIDV